MSETLKGTFEVHADGSVSGVLKHAGTSFHESAEKLRGCGYQTAAAFAEYLIDVGYTRRATIGPFPSGATLTTSGDKIVGRTAPDPNAPMLARDDREPTMREIKVMFGVRLLQAFAEAQRQDSASPRKAHPANANLLRG